MIKKITFVLLLACFFLISYAQKAPIKFGKPDLADLQMTVYDQDTSAEAVVLCQYGYFDPNRLLFTKTIRIKILKPEGTKWANWRFRSGFETNVEGYVYNLVNGEMVKEKLKSSNVYREKIFNQVFQYRVSFPNVKVGSVIDIEYMHPWVPIDFYFQYDIPVKWSELVIYQHNYLIFSKNFFGFVPFSEGSDNRWVASNVPAFHSEPFMNSEANYKTHFEFDIKSITYEGFKYHAIATSWENISKLLINDPDFGGAIQGAFFLNDEADRIEALTNAPKRRMIEAFNAIKRIKWDGNERIGISNNSLGTSYKNGIGNSSDVNLSLLKLLRKLDIEADPVVLSTRSNGNLSDYNPSINKLNYVIVQAVVDGKKYMLDATEKYMPYDLLPARTLNVQGRIVSNSKDYWVPLVTERKDKSTFFYDLTLTSDLLLTGKLTSSRSDYSALEFRNSFFSFTSPDEYVQDFEKSHQGYHILNFDFQNLDSLTQPVISKYSLEISDVAEQVGEEIHLNLFFDRRLNENPFKQEKRLTNIDFDYATEETLIVKIALPDSSTVISVPKPIKLSLQDNGGYMSYSIGYQGNSISVNFKWGLNKSRFTVIEYEYLKEFFNQLVMKQSEPVILKLKSI
ncbi:MAG: hypothetical protein HOO86_15950 [Bacteroidales bacterium]|nr:hypothetical protein [Bacteroidales bacterium]